MARDPLPLPRLAPYQHVRVVGPCGHEFDADARDRGSVPVTACPVCGRKVMVTVYVEEA